MTSEPSSELSSELKNMISLLKSQLGYGEQGGGYTKYGDWYGKTVEFDSDYSAQPWCDMLLSWAAHRLGYDKWFGQFAYTPNHAQWFVDHDAWGDTPEVGAVVFYDWSGSGTVDGIDHVGMVVAVDGGTIRTIEGNVDGGHVREKTREQTYVVGYGYPEKVKLAMDASAKTSPTSLTGTASVTLAAAETPLTATTSAGLAGVLLPVLLAVLVLAALLGTVRHSVRRPRAERPTAG
ncbi:hypothetical protein Skr01_06560 [Sphaerisporangium krabiense]|uniref:Peptidase C51 domain-containing protein n=1 Tax=Sphaerisporangium krabiense TaxID=763782 RepID=A0A7W8Z6W8_9ACTN|nr:CHAP domain-containing protein [Sphaerisporangium krabiense]MBB5628593.1 hypothetical protein [Sphaerisporangium krabiense]GII60571.1 hypothetical protein Skr01_06560 [Sphaerisporangium krabiense]